MGEPPMKRYKNKNKMNGMFYGKGPDGDEKFVIFYGNTDYFSNFYPSQYTLNEKSFHCNEHYFQYMKAVEFNDKEMQTAILKADTPNLTKSLGRKVANFDPDVWDKKSVEIMKDACRAKFSQNEELKEVLLGTEGCTIAEAAPKDLIWGIGVGKRNPECFDRSKWRGKNLLGEILMEIRDEFLTKQKSKES